jgi:hypothetical protein
LPNPSLTIDLVPAILAFAVIGPIACIVLAICLRRASTHRELWAAGILSFAVGMLCIIARGQIPDVVSILGGNLLVIGGYAGFGAGTRRFVERDIGLPLAIGAAAAVAFTVAYAAGATLETRVAVISILSLAESVVLVSGFLRARRHWAASLAAAVFALNGLLALLRLLGVLHVIAVPGGIDLLHALVLNYGIAIALGITLALIALNAPLLRPGAAIAGGTAATAAPAATEGWLLLEERSVLVAPNGAEVRLTGSEYLLLRQLGGSDVPVARGTLNAVIGRDPANPKDRSIDITISRLRRKCADAGIELPVTSVRGMGYVFHGRLRLGGAR